MRRAPLRPPRYYATQREKVWDTASILLLLLTVTLPYLPHFETEIHGVRIDPVSLFLGPALLLTVSASALGSLRSTVSLKDLPHRKLWLLYGSLVGLAYVNGAYGLGYLTDVFRVAYQLSNYAWKELLLYPLVFVLFCRPRQVKVLVLAIIGASLLNVATTVLQGRSGQFPSGLFGLYSKNYLAATFLIPTFLSLGCAVYAVSLGKRAFYAAAFVTFLMAFWYAGSRGAVLAFAVGLTVFLAASDRRLWLVGISTGVILAVLIIKPDVGVQSGIRDHFTAASAGTDEGNLKWRTTERWPYFLNKVQEHPWLGIGTDWDPDLDVAMNVPHNGYLSLAVRSGVPALLIFLGLVLTLLCWALSIGRKSPDPWVRGIGLGVSSGIAALCVHNLVDAVLDRGVVLYTFWTMFSIVAISRRTIRPRPGNAKRGRPRWPSKVHGGVMSLSPTAVAH